MPSNNFRNILILLLYLVTVVITNTTSIECPEHCKCTDSYLINTDEVFNKAKCTSLTGLKGNYGKKSSLNSIDLSDLNLARMSTNLENFKNLTELNLSYNQLIEINKLNKRITNLNLSHNQLVSGKISKIPLFVHHLDLSYNQITYLPRDVMRLNRLRKLELTGNPIDCNCETIQVRNWLQRSHVWSDRSVQCSTPLLYRDRSWLQVKESDVCNKPKTKSNADIWESDDDEMMLGDSPVIDDGSGHTEGSGDDLHSNIIKDELLPSDIGRHLKVDQDHDHNHHHDHDEEEEGSGLDGLGAPLTDTIDEDGSGSGSGSGSGLFNFPETTTEEPVSYNGSISYEPPGIFESETKTPVEEAPLERKKHKGVLSDVKEEPKQETEKVPGVVTTDEAVQGSILKTPEEGKKDEDNDIGVYILLVVIGVIFVALLIIVAMKRKQQPSKRTYDPELARGTELKTMDRNNLGKPAEFMPLMGEKPVEKPINALDAPQLSSFKPKSDEDIIRQPLLKPDDLGKETSVPNGKSPYTEDKPNNNNIDNLPNGNDVSKPGEVVKPPVPAARTQVPIVPVHQTIPNDMEKEINGLQPTDATSNDGNDDVFLPAEPPVSETPTKANDAPPSVADEMDSKPKSPLLNPSRYSPVYSPDTGRVKIKLTNLPKPKTPLLVNRSRSNAGDIILTTSPEATRKQ